MVVMNMNSFLSFTATASRSALFNLHGILPEDQIFEVPELACLVATALGALGLLPDWGKEQKLSAPSGDVPASTVILHG